MTYSKQLVDLGAPNPDLETSPIFLDIDNERQVVEPDIPEERVCYFNGQSFEHGTYIKSAASILKCDRGAWVEADMAD